MSVILNEEYGHAVLDHLDVFDICVLYRVDRATRSFLTSSNLVGSRTFGEYIVNLASDLKDKLLVCAELDLLEMFKHIIDGLDVDTLLMEGVDVEGHTFNQITKACNRAISQGKVEYLEASMKVLHSLYDWKHDDDYTFGFLGTAIKYNKPSVVKYILERSDDESKPRDIIYIRDHLNCGLRAATKMMNHDAARFFLDHPKMVIHSPQFNCLLELGSDIYDKYANRAILSVFWSDDWSAVKTSLEVVLKHDDSYLVEKVRTLALELSTSSVVRNNILSGSYR